MNEQHDRDGLFGKLQRFGRGRSAQPSRSQTSTVYPVPPSRQNRKALTTWQDALALKELRSVANETGLSQQALIAEGLNYVLAKYGRPSVAT
jgi:hypothetical protein